MNLGEIGKKVLLQPVIAKAVLRASRVVQHGYEQDIFRRFDEGQLFRSLLDPSDGGWQQRFAHLDRYILTDQPVSARVRALGTVISSLDHLSDEQIGAGLFLIYFLCDSDALPALRRITAAGGKYVPHASFEKADYRFTDRRVHNALSRSWARRDRVSHLNPIVHENICEALSITRHLEGDYVEIGVFRGGSALTALHFIDEMRRADPGYPRRRAWLLGTFDGFNYDQAFDSPDVIWAGTHALDGVGRTMAYIHETLTEAGPAFQLVAANICADPLPAGITHIAVANIDVDMFEPTFDALNKVAPLMVPGGVIICEDPASTPGLYGALQAMEDFLASKAGQSYVKIFKRGQYFLLKPAD